MNTRLSNHDLPSHAEDDNESHWPDVAGMVLQVARLSADVSSQQLAAATGVDEQIIHRWESGIEPLASVSASQLDGLKEALRSVNVHQQIVADLDAATWCDVVLDAMAGHADINCLLADPLARERAFGELLSWAISGRMPERYAEFARDVTSANPE